MGPDAFWWNHRTGFLQSGSPRAMFSSFHHGVSFYRVRNYHDDLAVGGSDMAAKIWEESRIL